jgi:hypothetical protein
MRTRESRASALIRDVFTGLRGPVENLTNEPCEGRYLRSFRKDMRGVHDLLRQKPSSMFILL